jgi:glutaryl-CoA dehydrogenase
MTQTDFFNISELLTEEQRLIQQAVRDFSDKEIKPVIEDFAEKAAFPLHLILKFGKLGVFGPTIPAEYGGGGLDYTSYGLMCQEIEKGDSGMRSTVSVQSSLVMWPIYAFGFGRTKEEIFAETRYR